MTFHYLLGEEKLTPNALVASVPVPSIFVAPVHYLFVIVSLSTQTVLRQYKYAWGMIESCIWMYIGILTSIASWAFGTNDGTIFRVPGAKEGEDQYRRYQFVLFSWRSVGGPPEHYKAQLDKKDSLIDIQHSQLEQKNSLIDDLQHEIARLSNNKTSANFKPSRSPLKVLMPSAVRSYFDLDKYDMGMDSDSDSEDSSFSEELKGISMRSLLGNHTGGADIPVEPDSSSSSTSTSSKRDPQYHKVSPSALWSITIDPSAVDLQQRKVSEADDEDDEMLFGEQMAKRKSPGKRDPKTGGTVNTFLQEIVEESNNEKSPRKNTYTAKTIRHLS